ncbi:hypothetical protein, partial [Mesorhizobium sp.]|uniref:hypothetical protein n=1 Tax=Mesorhizobium sp. TaxID=1871066 RepID=UPI0025B949A3
VRPSPTTARSRGKGSAVTSRVVFIALPIRPFRFQGISKDPRHRQANPGPQKKFAAPRIPERIPNVLAATALQQENL